MKSLKSLIYLLFGGLQYIFTTRNSDEAHQAYVKLYSITNGFSSRLIHQIHKFLLFLLFDFLKHVTLTSWTWSDRGYITYATLRYGWIPHPAGWLASVYWGRQVVFEVWTRAFQCEYITREKIYNFYFL